MHATFVMLWLQVMQPLGNVHGTKWTPHVKRDCDVAVHIIAVVTVAYESRGRWRSPRQHNHDDVLVSSKRRADDVTSERRREGFVTVNHLSNHVLYTFFAGWSPPDAEQNETKLIIVRQLHYDVTCGRFENRVKFLKQKEHRKLLPTSNFVR